MTTQYHKNEDGELILDEDGDPIPDNICLCHAYEASECICGAWDDVEDFDEWHLLMGPAKGRRDLGVSKMKVIVAGSREGFVARNVFEAIEQSQFLISEVVSGTAKGVDRDGEYYARCNKIPIKQFPADWESLGKAAGFIRNKQMAEYADALVAVWDGTSRGTHNMIKTMEALGKPVYVYKT